MSTCLFFSKWQNILQRRIQREEGGATLRVQLSLFHADVEENWLKFEVSALTFGVGTPPSGESWICHCLLSKIPLCVAFLFYKKSSFYRRGIKSIISVIWTFSFVKVSESYYQYARHQRTDFAAPLCKLRNFSFYDYCYLQLHYINWKKNVINQGNVKLIVRKIVKRNDVLCCQNVPNWTWITLGICNEDDHINFLSLNMKTSDHLPSINQLSFLKMCVFRTFWKKKCLAPPPMGNSGSVTVKTSQWATVRSEIVRREGKKEWAV